MALIHVTGNPRAGKTSYVVARNLKENMTFLNWRYASACSYIKNRNKYRGASQSLPPQRHVVFSNVLITSRFPTMQSYNMSGWEFGAPNNFCKVTRPLMPYGVYIFDEAQRYFDSKGDRELPPWVTQAFELRGHIFIDIFLITQRVVRLHRDIRSIADERIHIEKSIHTYIINGKKVLSDKFLNKGRLIKTVWHGRSFSTMGEHERYVEGEKKEDKKLGKPFKYCFKGNIKAHYDPYAYAVEMENLDDDFNYYDNDNIMQRPSEWSNYKKQVKEDGKQRKNKVE